MKVLGATVYYCFVVGNRKCHPRDTKERVAV